MSSISPYLAIWLSIFLFSCATNSEKDRPPDGMKNKTMSEEKSRDFDPCNINSNLPVCNGKNESAGKVQNN